jgi:RHS repeat-associated protein
VAAHRVRVVVAAVFLIVAALPSTALATSAARASLGVSKPLTLSVHHNTAKGFAPPAGGVPSFGASTSFSTPCCMGNNAVHQFAVADVNRDGIPDLVSADTAGATDAPGVLVALGVGDGTFHAPTVYSISNGVVSVALGDINGDGFLDIVASELGGAKIDILLGKGDGTFQAPSLMSVVGATDVRLGDLNGDGKLDLVTTGGHTVAVFFGNGDGTFGAPTTYPVHGTGNSSTLAYLNGDNHLDIAVGDGYPPGADAATVGVLMNTGAGAFATEVTYPIGNTYAVTNNVVVADLNGDGVPDLVVSDVGAGGDAGVLLGQGGGTFGTFARLSGVSDSTGTLEVAVADVNGDGIPDIISANAPNYWNSSNEMRVYPGNGDGTFGAALHFAASPTDSSRTLVATDLNRDGKPDVLFGNIRSFTEFLNTTPGVFTPIGGPLTSSELRGGANFCYPCWLNHYLHSQIADPVEAQSGNLTETVADVSIPGRGIPLAFTRTYNSQAAATNGPLGYGWTMGFGASLSQDGVTGRVIITQENGAQVIFAKVGTASPATYAPIAPRTIATLVNNADGTWTFTRLANESLTFNAAGEVTKMADRNGYLTTLTYTGGLLTKVTDQAARTLTLSYTGALLTKVNDDQTGRNVLFGYNDGSGNLTDVTDVNGGNTHYVYEAGHLLDTVRDARVNTVTTNHYDGSSPERVDWQKDGLLRKTSFVYSTTGACNTTITDPKGNVTCDVFVAGLKTAETRGYGTAQAATWTYTYDPLTVAPTAITDPNSHTSYMTYDASGNVLSASDALTRTTVAAYNVFNEPLTQTDPLGVTTTLTYDANGNRLTTSRPLTGTSQVQTTTNHYGDSVHPGDVTSVTDPDSKTSTLTYDTYGDLASSADPLGQTTTHTYNADGWILTDVSPKGNVSGCGCAAQYTTTYSYVVPGLGTTDEWGDVQTVTDPVAHVTTYGYDADRNVTTLKDGTGNLTTYVFDAANQQTQVKRADTPQTTVTTDYNLDGTVLDQKDGKGNPIQTYGYNSLAQVTSVKDALNNETDFSYDGVGNQLTKQDPSGNCSTASKCTTSTYDGANELKSVAYSDGVTPNVTGILYDADGQRTAWTDGSGAWTQVFDSLHRRTSVTEGASGTVAYVYNLRNLPTTITYPGGVHTVIETYDDAGRWTKVQDWNGNLTTIGYDVNSNLTSYTLPTATTVVDTMAYNKADQLTSITDKAGAIAFYAASYTYNAASQLITDTSAPAAQAKFHYTALNQLCYAGSANSTSCPNAPTGSEPFAYDAADNLVKLNTTTQQFNAADQLCWTVSGSSSNACTAPPTGATAYTYDSNGNRTAQVPSAGAATCDSYDQANRLVKVTTGTGASCTSPTTLGTYSYNGSGLRMGKTVAGVSTTEAWDPSGGIPLLLEDKTASATVDYVFGPGGVPLEQIGTATLWYHHDQLGSTRAITNGSGVTQATYQYDPYGKLIASTGSVTNPFMYSGQYNDSESGLYYLRARYYDSATAQFLTRDPMVGTTRSAYGYVSGNPLNGSDPTGQYASQDDAGGLLGPPAAVIVGGAIAIYAAGKAVIGAESWLWAHLSNMLGSGEGDAASNVLCATATNIGYGHAWTDKPGYWRRLRGIESPEELAGTVQEVINADSGTKFGSRTKHQHDGITVWEDPGNPDGGTAYVDGEFPVPGDEVMAPPGPAALPSDG